MDCSFCGRTQDQASRIICGPSEVAICEDCVRLCARILDTESATIDDVRGWIGQQISRR